MTFDVQWNQRDGKESAGSSNLKGRINYCTQSRKSIWWCTPWAVMAVCLFARPVSFSHGRKHEALLLNDTHTSLCSSHGVRCPVASDSKCRIEYVNPVPETTVSSTTPHGGARTGSGEVKWISYGINPPSHRFNIHEIVPSFSSVRNSLAEPVKLQYPSATKDSGEIWMETR